MRAFDTFNPNNVWELQPPYRNYRILPEDSLVLRIKLEESWDADLKLDYSKIFAALPTEQYSHVFLDVSFDPLFLYNDGIENLISVFQQHFSNSRVSMLSGQCSHYFENLPNVLYYPNWFLTWHHDSSPVQRRGRVGCLNRRPAPHRIWLMHNLLKDQLIDHERDIFSVSFVNPDTQVRSDVLSRWLPAEHLPVDLSVYPDSMATQDDGFVNDHSTTHPAWHTAVTIVTETVANHRAIITEKTIKAIMANCCWIGYNGSDAYRVLQALGFDLGMFDQHASDFNVEPIVNMCKTLDTESVALDYYQSRLNVIEHNKSVLEQNHWLKAYQRKLKEFLNNG